MRINIATLFPHYFEGPLGLSIPARARAAGLVEYGIIDLRVHAPNPRVTDDEPFGGGGGMVLKPEPFDAALTALGEADGAGRVVSLSPRGRLLDHEVAARLSLEPTLTLLCGRYKGIDERVVERWVDEEVSVGDYVLSGGEPAALVVIDAVVRLLPGALGDHRSAASDSFYEGLLSAPVYTRPATCGGLAVPEALRSGDHGRVRRWREARAADATRRRRPDLLDIDAAD